MLQDTRPLHPGSTRDMYTVVPVFRGLCDQGTPAVSGQYNDVRGDFQYKLTLDQGTPANADADRHLFVIFAPQPGDSALFILFFITLGRKRYHTGSQTLSNLFAHSIAQTDVNSRSPKNNDASRRCASWDKWGLFWRSMIVSIYAKTDVFQVLILNVLINW